MRLTQPHLDWQTASIPCPLQIEKTQVLVSGAESPRLLHPVPPAVAGPATWKEPGPVSLASCPVGAEVPHQERSLEVTRVFPGVEAVQKKRELQSSTQRQRLFERVWKVPV